MSNNDYVDISNSISNITNDMGIMNTAISSNATRLNTCFNIVNNMGTYDPNVYINYTDCTYTYTNIKFPIFAHNETIIIGNNTTNCYGMFYNCSYFNSPVTIGNNVTNCDYMFWCCYNFNSPVTIGNNVSNCSNMFANCNNFNQPVIIPNSAIDCYNMFANCRNFNQPVTIGNNVSNCCYMFQGCANLSQSSIIIGNNVNNIHGMFYGINHISDIYIYSNKFTNTSNTAACLYAVRSSFRKNIHIYSNMSSYFSWTTAQNTIVLQNVTWSSMTNGFYNAGYNVYVYTNLQPR